MIFDVYSFLVIPSLVKFNKHPYPCLSMQPKAGQIVLFKMHSHSFKKKNYATEFSEIQVILLLSIFLL